METTTRRDCAARLFRPQDPFDAGPGPAARIGLLVLATDQVSEGATRAMIQAMGPAEAVALYVSRLANANPTTAANLRSMAPAIAAAVELLLPDDRIDAVIYACTSGAIAIGDDVVREQVWRARPGVPVVTPGSAVVTALAAMGVHRVSLVLPYVDEVNAIVRGYVEGAGVEVVDAVSFGLLSDVDMAKLSTQALAAAALAADHPQAEAICILCTALRATPVIADLEARLGKPVITSHQAMLWNSLRAIGNRMAVDGFGMLMER